MDIETIRQEILSLPAPERARLAELLLSSLENLTEEEINQLWLQEAATSCERDGSGLSTAYSR